MVHADEKWRRLPDRNFHVSDGVNSAENRDRRPSGCILEQLHFVDVDIDPEMRNFSCHPVTRIHSGHLRYRRSLSLPCYDVVSLQGIRIQDYIDSQPVNVVLRVYMSLYITCRKRRSSLMDPSYNSRRASLRSSGRITPMIFRISMY